MTACGEPWFVDFSYPADLRYPDDDRPFGVIERNAPDKIVDLIRGVAARVRDGYGADGWPHARCRCEVMASSWAAALMAEGGVAQCIGGMGDAYEAPAGAAPDANGYRRKDDTIGKHYWVVIGPEQFIFDPTAYQFDPRGVCHVVGMAESGGIRLDRYVIDGRPFIESRPR